jgi:peptidoglycan/LPS O-acetylase OafA/YrhL
MLQSRRSWIPKSNAMNRTIDVGAGLLTLGGLLLVVGLFLPWFDGDGAWTAFEALDLLLAALAIGALAAGSGRLGEDARAGIAIALAALVAVAVQLIDPPPAYSNADLDSGAWFSLVAAALMVAGAAQTIASFSVSVDVRGRERRPRVEVVDRRQAEPEPEPEPEPGQDDQRTQSMKAVEAE